MLGTIARGAPSPIWRRYVSPPDNPPGTDLTIAPTTGRVWEVLALNLMFLPSAVAGNRILTLFHVDGDGNSLGVWPLTAALVASADRAISWQAGLGALLIGAAPIIAVPMAPRVYVMPGEHLLVSGWTDTGDQFTRIRGVVLETNYGDPAYDEALEQRIADHWRAIHDLIGENP